MFYVKVVLIMLAKKGKLRREITDFLIKEGKPCSLGSIHSGISSSNPSRLVQSTSQMIRFLISEGVLQKYDDGYFFTKSFYVELDSYVKRLSKYSWGWLS